MLALLILAPALAAGTFNVSIQSFAFTPDSLVVRPGDTVRWTNLDGFNHTSTGTGTGAGQWNSGNIAANATFQHVFSTAGLYDYHCNIHSSMTAKVNVSATSAIYPAPGTNPEAQAEAQVEAQALRDARGRALHHDHGKAPIPASPAFPAP